MASPSGLQFTHSQSIDPLKRHCSIATIQSDPKGHFSALVDQLRKQENFQHVLLQINNFNGNNFEILRFVSQMEAMSMFSPQPIFKKKDEEFSIKQRLIGNDLFKKGKIHEAFAHYSHSILKAEYNKTSKSKDGKSTLALSLGNRSACLFQSGDYDLAISDINFALSVGYPEDIKYKLYDRLGRCHLKNCNPVKAKPSFLIATQLLSKCDDIDEKKKLELKNSLESLIQECENSINVKDKIRNIKENKTMPDIQIHIDDMIRSKEYPALAEKLEIIQDNIVGRHIIAKESLKLGETVLTESPYAAVLYPENNGKNCHNCFEKMKAIIPCKNCAGVAYCTTFCRDEAADSYHMYECEFQEVLTGLGCSQISRLALRMITIKPFKYFLNLKDRLSSSSNNNDAADDDYVRVHNLVGLTEKRWPEENLIRCALALVLLSILRASGYFGEKKSSTRGQSFSPNELFFGGLLLRNLQILQFNAHEVYEMMRSKKTNLKPCKNSVIGLAIYPTASYFNHSCHPGLSRCFKGRNMVLKTLHPVQPGEEVSENYGYAFYLKTRNDRRKELSARYWFDCGCIACERNWPLLDKLSTIKEGSNGGEGIKSASLDKASELMEKGEPNKALNHLSDYVNCFYQEEMKPCQDQIKAEDKARTCISNLGNVVFTEDLVLSQKKKC